MDLLLKKEKTERKKETVSLVARDRSAKEKQVFCPTPVVLLVSGICERPVSTRIPSSRALIPAWLSGNSRPWSLTPPGDAKTTSPSIHPAGVKKKQREMSETTNLEHKQEASSRFGRKVVGRSSAGPLRDHIVWVWDPQGCLFTSTHREGWENAGGDAEGGLLLGITSPMNIFSSLLDLLDRKKKKKRVFHLHFLPPLEGLSQLDDIWIWKSEMSGWWIWLP